MKRCVIAVFTVCALLAQGATWAFAGPMLPPAPTEQSMPCHEEAVDVAMACCGDACDCADLCAGHASAVLPSFFFAAPLRADLQPQTFTGLRLSVNHTRRLRPPITVQS